MDIFVEQIGKLSQNISTSNDSTILMFNQLSKYLEETNKSNQKEAMMFDNLSSSLKELNVNQFTMTSTLEDAIDRVTNTISSEHRTLKLLLDTQENINKKLKN
jgi:hypothetical protein